jgi:hypothetical protein
VGGGRRRLWRRLGAHIALGYASWDEYVDDRLSDLRLTVPREQRGAVVQSLSRAQMSLRAIAKVLGVDPATVHRALGTANAVDRDDPEEPASIRGRDGKSYPRRRRPRAPVTDTSLWFPEWPIKRHGGEHTE